MGMSMKAFTGILLVLVVWAMQTLRADASEAVQGRNGSIVFSCPVEGGKFAQVLVKDKMLQYKFGADPRQPEIAVPVDPRDQSQVHYAYTAYAKGGSLYIRFTNGDYSYVVYSGQGEGWAREDITVFKGLDKVKRINCVQQARSTAVYDFIAYGNDDSANGLDIVYGQQ